MCDAENRGQSQQNRSTKHGINVVVPSTTIDYANRRRWDKFERLGTLGLVWYAFTIVIYDQRWLGVQREGGTGEGGRVGGFLRRQRRLILEGKGYVRQWECGHGVWTLQRNVKRERRAMGAMGKRELAFVLTKKAGGGRTGEGRQRAKQMVVEWSS